MTHTVYVSSLEQLGAQLDITSLMYHYTGLTTLRKLQELHTGKPEFDHTQNIIYGDRRRDPFKDLSATFNAQELKHIATLHGRIGGSKGKEEGLYRPQEQERAPISILSIEMDQSASYGTSKTVPSFIGFYQNVSHAHSYHPFGAVTDGHSLFL